MSKLKNTLKAFMYLGLCTASALAFAEGESGGATDLSGIASGLTTQVQQLADLLVMVAYVCGIGFALAGVIQFKAHKDNPAQVPLSKPIVYVAVGACLLFLPAVLGSAGKTIFGDKATKSAQGGAGGVSDGITWS